MTSMNPPAMGWIFFDKETLKGRWGNKSASIDNIKGPWDWTDYEDGMTLEGKEAFVAVEEEPGEWALYFDRHENGRGLPQGKLSLPISLDREPTEEKDQQVD